MRRVVAGGMCCNTMSDSTRSQMRVRERRELGRSWPDADRHRPGSRLWRPASSTIEGARRPSTRIVFSLSKSGTPAPGRAVRRRSRSRAPARSRSRQPRLGRLPEDRGDIRHHRPRRRRRCPTIALRVPARGRSPSRDWPGRAPPSRREASVSRLTPVPGGRGSPVACFARRMDGGRGRTAAGKGSTGRARRRRGGRRRLMGESPPTRARGGGSRMNRRSRRAGSMAGPAPSLDEVHGHPSPGEPDHESRHRAGPSRQAVERARSATTPSRRTSLPGARRWRASARVSGTPTCAGGARRLPAASRTRRSTHDAAGGTARGGGDRERGTASSQAGRRAGLKQPAEQPVRGDAGSDRKLARGPMAQLGSRRAPAGGSSAEYRVCRKRVPSGRVPRDRSRSSRGGSRDCIPRPLYNGPEQNSLSDTRRPSRSSVSATSDSPSR